MKLAIGAGEVLTETLGGVFGRWELLVGGTPLAQLAQANALASAGQTVLSPQAWTLLHGQATASPIADGEGYVRLEGVGETHSAAAPATPLPLPPEASAAVRAFVPAAIRTRLDAGPADWLPRCRRRG